MKRSSRVGEEFFWLAWHGMAACIIAFVPSRLRYASLITLPSDALVFITGSAMAYLAFAVLLLRTVRRQGALELSDVRSALGACLAGLFVALALIQPVYSRWVVLATLILFVAFALLSLVLARRPGFRLGALTAAAVTLILTGVSGVAAPTIERGVVRSGAYDFVATYVRSPFASLNVTGGALDVFGDRYLLATGDGRLHALTWNDDASTLETRELAHRVPLNLDEFRALHPDDAVTNGRFRTGDILVRETESGVRLFASHHFWHGTRECFTVRVSSTSGTYREFLEAGEPAAWNLVYESEPCLRYPDGGLFGGLQMGGEMQFLDDDRLLAVSLRLPTARWLCSSQPQATEKLGP